MNGQFALLWGNFEFGHVEVVMRSWSLTVGSWVVGSKELCAARITVKRSACTEICSECFVCHMKHWLHCMSASMPRSHFCFAFAE